MPEGGDSAEKCLVKLCPFGFSLCRRNALEILQEKVGDDQKPLYLVKFFGLLEPEWVEEVTPLLLERWQQKQPEVQKARLNAALAGPEGGSSEAALESMADFCMKMLLHHVQRILRCTIRFSVRKIECITKNHIIRIPMPPDVSLLNLCMSVLLAFPHLPPSDRCRCSRWCFANRSRLLPNALAASSPAGGWAS